ncbi:hypothetical protein [Pseudozobellia sp. WGM2]|uniref:hypothetical protein n=1 Tax=Pseudozobellia sp. WGM2 TaxID=2787625 RepID=UPI001ADED7F4|nr:hypothetical protein [Pseudozobellia sp. WGM2]
MKNHKKISLSLMLLIVFLQFTSCGKDDGPETKQEVIEEPVVEQEEEEEEEIVEEQEEELSSEESNTISDNIVIVGGTKIEGAPPVPNEAIDLTLPNVSNTGVLDEGFSIPISSDADITGAYIQFKAVDGEVSDSYYDVDIIANQEGPEVSGKLRKDRRSRFGKNLVQTAKMTETELDIDLSSNIQPGEFCYIICVYDDAGNISAPQEVCVTIQAWGGNADLVGTWGLTRWEETYQGMTETEIVGEENCYEYGCDTTEFEKLVFNADGTFEYSGRYIFRDLDGQYGEEFLDFIETGKWSYPEGSENLIIVYYSISETDEDGTYEEVYEAGGSDDIITTPSGFLEITDSAMVITESYDDDGDGNFEEVYKAFYEKD